MRDSRDERHKPDAAPDDSHRISIDQAVRFAAALHKDGQLDKAEGLYKDILAVVPDHADVLHFLGVLRYQRGNPDDAIQLIQRALAAFPDYVDAHNNLGNIHMAQGDRPAAEACYRKTVQLAPGHVGAHNNLATVLRAMGKFQAAERIFRRALEISFDFHPLHYNLANLLVDQGRIAEAVEHYFQAMVLEPENAGSRTMLGIALMTLGKTDAAVSHFEKWLAEEPDNAEARHLLAACTGVAVPDRASDDYVKRVFDRFAENFDESLMHLDYQAPDLVAGALHAAVGPPAGDLKILDAGCGTGLCGPKLKPYAKRLDGVDLSAGMLAKAEAAGSYDQLTEDELTGYLVRCNGCFDVIVSADTLCYFGELGDAFDACRAALKPGGHFIFTVEHAEQTGSAAPVDFFIRPQGRYAHAEAYIRRMARQAGLETTRIDRNDLRKEMGRPVAGLVVVLTRPVRLHRAPT